MKLFTVAEMVAAEESAAARGHSYLDMMEQAGRGLAEAIAERFDIAGRRILILVGSGNNGGDGLVAGRYLAEAGAEVAFHLHHVNTASAQTNLERAEALGMPLIYAQEDTDRRTLRAWVKSSPVIIDALLGTGVSRPISGRLAALLEQVRAVIEERAHEPAPRIVACDCPSGLNCDSGALDPLALPAALTVTFGGPKRGHFRFPGAEATGELVVAPIGLVADDTAHVRTEVGTADAMRALLPERPRDGHKGTFGFALIAAGSADYCGAPLLAGRAAYRAGCGLVALAVPGRLRPVVAGQLPEATYPAMPDEVDLGTPAAESLRAHLERYHSLLVGPGLGPNAGPFLETLFSSGGLPPLVVDADGLNWLSRHAEWWRTIPGNSVLTPHPGEMARLCGHEIDDDDRVELAREQAGAWGHVVLLKGAFTVVAAPDGRATLIPVADSRLAVAGSGDVLAGVVASLLAQRMTSYDAAVLGAYLHAKALDTIDRGGILAGELADGVARARQVLQARNATQT